MGAMYEALCLDCSHAFHARGGGGFHFIELHCMLCGQVESVSHDLISKPLERHHQAVCAAMDATGKPVEELLQQIKQRSLGMAIDRDKPIHLKEAIAKAMGDFDKAIEPIVGKCQCGGRLGLHAPVRCPACKSANIKEGKTLMQYD